VRCPYCDCDEFIKAGRRANKYVTKQIYRCKHCTRRFVKHDGFQGMTYPKELITKVLHMYIEGLSLAKIRDVVWQHEGFEVHDSTILSWVRKYAEVIQKSESGFKPKLKGRIHIDEVIVKVGKKKCYSLNAIDGKTKFNLCTRFISGLFLFEVRVFFKDLKQKVYDQILLRYKQGKKLICFVTDKLGQYLNAFNKFFLYTAKIVFGVPIACKRFGLRHNNNPIERHNQDIKQRYKVMRCFKSFKSAGAFLTLRRAVYNFVRSHSGLNRKTPAEAAGIKLGLIRNKLLELIEVCSLPAQF
jgi:transposase-like protein